MISEKSWTNINIKVTSLAAYAYLTLCWNTFKMNPYVCHEKRDLYLINLKTLENPWINVFIFFAKNIFLYYRILSVPYNHWGSSARELGIFALLIIRMCMVQEKATKFASPRFPCLLRVTFSTTTYTLLAIFFLILAMALFFWWYVHAGILVKKKFFIIIFGAVLSGTVWENDL